MKSQREIIAQLAKQIADHQMRIQLLGTTWGAYLNETLDASDKEFIVTLRRKLDNFEFTPNAAETLKRLHRIEASLLAIRQEAFSRAKTRIETDAKDLAVNEMKWARRVAKQLGAAAMIVPDKHSQRIVANALCGGKTMSEWFGNVADADAARITATVAQGVASGWTIDQMARNIAGTEKNDHKDGIFETTRREAVTMARTVCNGIANGAKEDFYQANSDVLKGVEILSTLDGRTCPVCASVDRKRYKMDEVHPSLPLHPNCRCVLLPVTMASDLTDEARPMANADFMAEAERAYKAKYPNKDWNALSDGTKKKYYYKAMRDFEERTGKPAYSQSDGSVSFKDYFLQMSEQQQEDYLGKERFKIWKKGHLSLDKFIPPYPKKRLTVAELKKLDKESFGD